MAFCSHFLLYKNQNICRMCLQDKKQCFINITHWFPESAMNSRGFGWDSVHFELSAKTFSERVVVGFFIELVSHNFWNPENLIKLKFQDGIWDVSYVYISWTTLEKNCFIYNMVKSKIWEIKKKPEISCTSDVLSWVWKGLVSTKTAPDQ